MIKIDVSSTRAVVRVQEPLTVGLTGAKVHFYFGAPWQSLIKTVVFRQGNVTKDVVEVTDCAVIPWEVLCKPGVPVEIGVYGTNSEGTVVIPTVWARTAPVREGTEPSADPGAQPTPEVWEQILGKLGNLGDLNTAETSNLVAAVNEANEAVCPVTVTKAADGTCSGDKTYVELAKAFDDGKTLCCKYRNRILPLSYMVGSQCAFTGIEDGKVYAVRILATGMVDVSETPLASGTSGGDGGYYTPAVSQTDENTVKVSFAPSKEGMEAIADQEIILPAGKDGADGRTPVKGEDYWTDEDKEEVQELVKDCPSYISVTEFAVGDNALTADMVGTAANWTADGNTFTHTAGSAEPLHIAMGNLAVAGDEWLITFDSPNITGDVLYASFGSEALTKTYNGLTAIAVAVRVKEDGDDLLLTPVSSFNGTLTNFQVRKISANGTGMFRFESDSIINKDTQLAKTGFWNVVLGTDHTMTNALSSSRTIAIGHNALHSLCVGSRNIGIGTFALQQLHYGEDNLAIGADSMGYLDHAERCTAFGVKSLVGYTDNIVDAVAIGTGAGFRGNQGTFIGSNAGCSNTGDDNTFIGCRAGAYNTTGSRNIIIGSYVEGQPTGMFNTIIGRNANYPDGAINCVAIGRNAIATKSGQVVIGSADTTEEVVLGGKKLIFNADGTVSWGAV